jgi:hypothetical protein
MLKALGSRLTYANVMATVAVFLALGGGAYALSGIPDRGGVFHGCVSNSTGVLRVVKSSSSCHRAVRHGKHRNPGESAVAWNQQGRPGIQGLQGLQGVQGVPGATGATGPSDTWVVDTTGGNASASLPVGSYVAHGAVLFHNAGATAVTRGCNWIVNTPTGDQVARDDFKAPAVTVPAASDYSYETTGALQVTGTGTFSLSLGCANGDGQLVVTRVGTLH